MDVFYSVAKLIFRIYHHMLFKNCEVCGELDKPPGAKIIAANHPNATDGFFLPFIFREKLHLFIQGDLFLLPFFRWLLTRCRQFPFWSNYKYAGLAAACDLLEEGKTVVNFPEDRLKPDQQPIKANTGAIRLSLIEGVEIIPVGFYVSSKHVRNIHVRKAGRLCQGRWQTGGHCSIRSGKPRLPRPEIGRKAVETSIHAPIARQRGGNEALAHRLSWNVHGKQKLFTSVEQL